MKIEIIRPQYIVRYYDEKGGYVGYSCVNASYLDECKETKEFCGKKINPAKTTVQKR